MNSKRMIAVLALIAVAFAACAVIQADEGDSASGKGPEIVDLKGDFTSKMTYTSEQTVIVVEDLNIRDGGSITIEGVLIVNEGITVTISGDNGRTDSGFAPSELIINGKATVNGNIVSKVTGGLTIEPARFCEVVINGTVTAMGDTSGIPVESAYIDSSDGTITVNGKLTVSYNAIAFIDGVVFSDGSEFRDLGEAVTSDGGGIRLSGKAYFNGKAASSPSGAFTVGLDNATAVIDIDSLTGTVTVTDAHMFVYSYGGAEYIICQDVESNVKKKALLYDSDDRSFLEIFPSFVTLSDINNVRVSVEVGTHIEYDPSYSRDQMVADEKITVEALDSKKTVSAVTSDAAMLFGDDSVTDGNGRALYIGSMDVDGVALTTVGSDGVSSTSDSNIVRVSGSLSFKKADITVEQNSVFIVEGLIVMDREIVLPSTDDCTGVFAAHFTQRDEKNNHTHYYTTLTRAIDMDVKSVNMIGCLYIRSNVSIPSPVKLTTDPDSDPSVEIRSGAILRIAEGAKFVNDNRIIVHGQFINENFDQGFTGDVIAEIRMKDGASTGYADVYAAMSKARSGDVLEAFGSSGGIILIDKNLTIPEGVTLDSQGHNVVVENGCTLTIKGKLIVNDADSLLRRASGSSPDNGWNSKTPAKAIDGSMKSYSVISVVGNGTIEYSNGSSSEQLTEFRNSGAYYYEDDNGTKGRTVFTSVKNAFAAILTAYENRVTIVGEVSIDGLKVAGTEKERMIVDISKGSKVTMSSFTFSYGVVNVYEGVKISGDIGTANGRMTLGGATILGDVAFSDSFIGGAMSLEVTGTIGSNNLTKVSGTVCLNDFRYATDPSDPYAQATLTFDEKRLSIQAGSNTSISGNSFFDGVELLAAGDLTVAKGASVRVTWISVTGSLTVAKTDGVPGYLWADYICVGGSTDNLKTAEAIVNGNATVAGEGTFNISGLSGLFVFNGATVTADVLASWIEDTARSTRYHVNGSHWLTAYQGTYGTVKINSLKPVNAGKSGSFWMTYDEKTKKYVDNVSDSTNVGKTGFEKVYAEVNSTVYGIRVIADAGINDVYIDGINMLKIGTTNTFTDNIPEGTHTITYTLANGYSGTASITSINGKMLEGGGLKFTANKENSVDYTMEITLSGIHKSGYDTDPDTHSAGTGFSVTNILLIVVAIVAGIIAVVVYTRRAKS